MNSTKNCCFGFEICPAYSDALNASLSSVIGDFTISEWKSNVCCLQRLREHWPTNEFSYYVAFAVAFVFKVGFCVQWV